MAIELDLHNISDADTPQPKIIESYQEGCTVRYFHFFDAVGDTSKFVVRLFDYGRAAKTARENITYLWGGI